MDVDRSALAWARTIALHDSRYNIPCDPFRNRAFSQLIGDKPINEAIVICKVYLEAYEKETLI